MRKFHIVKTPDIWIRWRKPLAGGYARISLVDAGATGNLGRLFDMVTMNGPVPEIETGQDDQAS